MKVTFEREGQGIQLASIHLGGKPLPFTNGKATAELEAGKNHLLHWSLIGSPGGAFRLAVTAAGKSAELVRARVPLSGQVRDFRYLQL